MKKLGRCSRCKEQLTKPGHKTKAGSILCDNCAGIHPPVDEFEAFKKRFGM